MNTDRKKLLDTAVKFLNNPRVVGSSQEHKIEFLEKKGLNKEEIEWALDQVKASNGYHGDHSSSVVPGSSGLGWGSVLMGGVSLGGIIVLIAYKLLNYWQEQRTVAVESDVQQLLTHLTESVSTLQESTNAIKTLLEQRTGSEKHLQDVQNELNTIKGLLLSRHQFPSTPSGGSHGNSIPSWQRSPPHQDDKDDESD